MVNNLKFYNLIPLNIKSTAPSLQGDLPFFKNWLVGFTNAEGSFFMKLNNDGCFQLKQVIHTELFEKIKLNLLINRNIEKASYNVQSVSSKEDIQKIINFFSFEGLHPLKGLKYIQYQKWLKNLKESSRYHNLRFPYF